MPAPAVRELWDQYPLEQTPVPTATPRVLEGPGYRITFPATTATATATHTALAPARDADVALVAWLPLATVIVIALVAAGWRALVWHDEHRPVDLIPLAIFDNERHIMTAEPHDQPAPLRHRDAVDGQFTTAEDAAARPAETVSERVVLSQRELAAARRLLEVALERDARVGERTYHTHAAQRAASQDRIDDLRAGIDAALILLA